MYVLVPPNCTDRLQPLDVSINKPVKDLLRKKFTDWYAEKIMTVALQPVDMKLGIMKPIGAKWIIKAFNYIQSHPLTWSEMVSRMLVSLTDFLKSKLFVNTAMMQFLSDTTYFRKKDKFFQSIKWPLMAD